MRADVMSRTSRRLRGAAWALAAVGAIAVGAYVAVPAVALAQAGQESPPLARRAPPTRARR